MQCSFGPLDEPEDCYYWGFIKSVDPSGKKMVFDLARFEYYGEEEYEFELVNRNPLLRTLQIADDVVVLACPPADGTSVPDLGCGSMSEFREYTVGDLESWVDNGAEFWGLRMDSDEIAIIEQWWHP